MYILYIIRYRLYLHKTDMDSSTHRMYVSQLPRFFQVLMLFDVPSGYINSSLLNMAIEIMDLPIDSMVIFHGYVK